MHELAPGSDTAIAPTAAWIQKLHVDLVGRLPDRRALVRRIAVRRDSHREIARGLLQSEDYCRAQISTLFRSLLDRDGDPDSVAAWTRALRSGIAVQDVIASICDGFEYKANHPDGPAFVESLYRRLLRRGSDPEGRTAALAALQQRSSTLAVVRGFLTSSEYCCQQVTELHVGLLGRAPDPAALSRQSLALMQGAPLQQIVLDVVTSDEYIARAAHRKAELTALKLELDDRPSALAPALDRDPDADVLALVGRDTRGALQRLMRRHGRAVYRYCRTALGDAVLADDIHQQVFIEAFRDLPGFAGRSTLRTWLFGIARHRVLDAAKRRRRARAYLDAASSADLPDPRPSPGEGLDDAQLQAALVDCLAALDEPIRAAVLLRYQQGLTYEEMAEICGEKAGTLQARVSRALRKLRDRLEGQRTK